MKIGFIGAGRMGFTLGKYLRDNGQDVAGFYSRDINHAKEAAAFTETLCYESLEDLIKNSDALFLTVNDTSIAGLYDDMKAYDLEGKILCHTSGALSSEVFADSERYGVYGYSVHPIYAVNSKYDSHKNFKEAYITIEGNEKYLDSVRDIFVSAGNRVQVIDKACKAKYHAASVCASNLVCGLYEMSVKMLTDCGFSHDMARLAINGLFLGNAENLGRAGAVIALTGPLERADADTMKKHLNALNENEKSVYISLSKEVLKIAKEKNPDRDYSEVEALIKD